MTMQLTQAPTMTKLCLSLSLALAPLSSQAAELSLVHGFFKNADVKGGFSSTELSLGARYSQQFHARMYWFGEAAFGFNSYSSDSGYSPQNSTNLALGGGLRYYFDRFSERIAPYGSFAASLKTERTAIKPGSYFVETDKNGLYYGAAIGLRLSLDPKFFLDLETPLFSSALFANEATTEIVVQTGGQRAENKSEASKYEIFADTKGAFSELIVSLGLRI